MIFLFTLIIALLAGPWTPWWSLPVIAGIVGFWRLRRLWRVLPQAFLAGVLAWGSPALWFDARNGSLLSAKIAQLFHLPGPLGILAVTGIVAGTLASLGAMVGQRIRKALTRLSDT